MKIGSMVFRNDSTSAGRGAVAAAVPRAWARPDSAEGDDVREIPTMKVATPAINRLLRIRHGDTTTLCGLMVGYYSLPLR